MRLRVRFAKTGDLRFIGHRDLMESFLRLLRRARIRPNYSLGFHPKPKVSFPTALPLNVVGEDEVLEMEMPDDTDADWVFTQLCKSTIPNLTFLSVEALPEGTKKAKVLDFTYTFAIPEERRDALRQRILWISEQPSLPFQRLGKEKVVDIKKTLLNCQLLEDGTLQFQLRGDLADGCGPRDFLAALEIGDLETCGSVLVRKNVHIE